jgi:hypothetical protein
MARGFSVGLLTLALLSLGTASAPAWDETLYPDLRGQWSRISPPGQPSFDPNKPRGYGQEVPYTEEYKKRFEEILADLRSGGEGSWPGYRCRPPGMPPLMTAYEPMEVIVTPSTTFIRIDHIHETARRIYTDGRDWPKDVTPAYQGYSIGKWVDENGDGKFDVLTIETRHIKGKRAYDASGLPLHDDAQTVVKERIFLDKSNPAILIDELTVIDNAMTKPWVVTKTYSRNANPKPYWREYVCAEQNAHVRIGDNAYFMSADGYLMPSKKGQKPPDLTNFQAQR